MTSIDERFDELIKSLGLNQKTFAESIGKAPTVIYNVCNGRNKPGFDLLESIFEKYPDVNPTWLMKGQGEMMQGMATLSKGGGGDLEAILLERIKSANETISDLRYTVELQKKLLSGGKFKGVPVDRFGRRKPLFFGPASNKVGNTPVSARY